MTSPANTSGSDRETGTVERLVAEMQAGLEGVTPGPWGITHDAEGEPYIQADYRTGPLQHYVVSVAYDMRTKDMQHVARCSPDNIAVILSELTHLKARADAAEARAKEANGWIASYERERERWIEDADARIGAAEAKLATAREALASLKAKIAAGHETFGIDGGDLREWMSDIDAISRLITEGADHERS